MLLSVLLLDIQHLNVEQQCMNEWRPLWNITPTVRVPVKNHHHRHWRSPVSPSARKTFPPSTESRATIHQMCVRGIMPRKPFARRTRPRSYTLALATVRSASHQSPSLSVSVASALAFAAVRKTRTRALLQVEKVNHTAWCDVLRAVFDGNSGEYHYDV